MVITAYAVYIGTLQKLKRLSSTIATETLSLVNRCDVKIYINDLLFELLRTKSNCLN